MAQKTFLVARRSDQAISGLHTTHGCRATVAELLAELLADSLEALSHVRGRIRLMDGVPNIETNRLLSTSKL